MFAIWALGIMGAATAVILYQHAHHTGIVLSALGGSMGAAAGGAGVSGTISANPLNTGAVSRASGQWTPLGPQGMSIFNYMPPQPGTVYQ